MLSNRFTFMSSAMKGCLVIIVFSVHFCTRLHKSSNYRLMTCEYNKSNPIKKTIDKDVWKRIPKWAAKCSGVHFRWFSIFTLTPSVINLSMPVKLPKSRNRIEFVLFQLQAEIIFGITTVWFIRNMSSSKKNWREILVKWTFKSSKFQNWK